MICPKCGGENCHFVSHTKTTSGSFCDGCCGFLIFGPIGILCGLCDSSSSTKEYWVCDSCGTKFQKGGVVKRNENVQNRISIPDKSIQDKNVIDVPPTQITNILEQYAIPEGTDRVSTGNILNECRAAYYCGNIYYVKASGLTKDDRIIRYLNGIKTEVIANGARCLFADEDTLYYIADNKEKKLNYTFKMYRLPNGADKGYMMCDATVSQIYFYGEYIYYINKDDGNSVYRMRKDGGVDEKFYSANASNLIVYDKTVYFINEDENRNVYAVAVDKSFDKILIENGFTDKFCISDGVLYYSLTQKEEQSKVYFVNLSTGEEKSIDKLANKLEFVNVYNKYVYFRNDGVIYRYNIYSGETSTIPINTKNWIKYLNFTNGLMFYDCYFEIEGVLRFDGMKYGSI
jgi:hypothetical protein